MSTLSVDGVGSVELVSSWCRLTPVSTVSTVSRECRDSVESVEPGLKRRPGPSTRRFLGPKVLRQPQQAQWWISGRPHDQIWPSCGPTARAMMLVDRSDEKKWCHRASMRSTSCSGKTTVPSGSTSNSGACANRASSGQLEDARHPCITRGQWGGMPRPWRPTARPWRGTDRRRFEEP